MSWRNSIGHNHSKDFMNQYLIAFPLLLEEGTHVHFLYKPLTSSGPWDGIRFGGDPQLEGTPVLNHIFVYNTSYIYYTFENNDSSIISRLVVNQIEEQGPTNRGDHVSISSFWGSSVGINQLVVDLEKDLPQKQSVKPPNNPIKNSSNRYQLRTCKLLNVDQSNKSQKGRARNGVMGIGEDERNIDNM
ncbi:hypothetical protein CFP56_018146 [Quercus suber]|uniref:Uncharacterized protein n=1 Tax=Quercus suber TaxID=58331 RepID=A0AAW0KKU5_QUESU